MDFNGPGSPPCKFGTLKKSKKISTILFFLNYMYYKNEEIVEGTLLMVYKHGNY